jgi:hypothetical protein
MIAFNYHLVIKNEIGHLIMIEIDFGYPNGDENTCCSWLPLDNQDSILII